eukprot:CAMPEP_0205803884 /NCGR_PEP_ID=MMETSP0205-20121125/6636_1 /ASSEMBLY_ACC=CAM_ASM_000278 /TAXON_ID=36767 /ORGANISM="Euplotes focardii, Strain TN1" /LENGTH=122 /DNA_ID=CAMNT_0053072605 /DNA_START=167 /DNA_END=535 /DNA_ORIENTATION=+
MRRGRHPYFSATYINGYVREVALRNLEEELIVEKLQAVYTAFGRKPLRHSIYEVSKDNISIQGKWNDDLWGKYPKHEMENKRLIPTLEEEFHEDLPREPKIRKLPKFIQTSRKNETIVYPND